MKPTPTPPRKRTGPPGIHPTEEPTTKTFSVLPSDLRTLTDLGDGNRSAGLRAVLASYRRIPTGFPDLDKRPTPTP